MSALNDEQKPDSTEMLPLIRYLSVLVAKYPRPITPKQLAHLSKVSIAAVSKVRDKLFPICNMTSLASTRRTLLLRNDPDTVGRIGFAFYMDSKLGLFLRSSYAQSSVRHWVLDAHSNLARAIPDYGEFFDAEDALFISNLAIRALADGLDHLRKVSIANLDPEGLRAVVLNQVIELMDEALPKLSKYLKDENTLERILIIRDKLWCMTRYIANRVVVQASSMILSTLPDEVSRQQYVSVYRHTSEFYIEKLIFETITMKIKEAADSVNVTWKTAYDTLGSMYTSAKSAKGAMEITRFPDRLCLQSRVHL